MIILPFTIIIDTREKSPFHFRGIATDEKPRDQLVVKTRYATLSTGDYSIEGHEDQVTVERKSKEDAYLSFGTNRNRFQREFERMSAMDHAAVVIEADWLNLMRPPHMSKMRSKSIYRTVIAWSQRYGVHFYTCPGKRFAEITTLRILERWWKDHE